MKFCLILALCLTSVYCADWNKFREGTHTTISLLEERLKSLTNHAEELVKKPEKEAIEVVIDNVKDELGHVSDLEKSIKPELAKNHTLISQIFFLEKTVSEISLIRAELNQLLKALQDVEKTIEKSAFYAATVAPTPDYRQLYDHLLMESINEKIREGERFLERISHQLVEFQTTHSEEVHAQIMRELNFALPLVQGVTHHFDEELKKTGLNTFERFFIEKAKTETQLMIKALTTIQNAVKVHGPDVTKAPVFFAPTQAPTQAPADWRQAYDQLLFSFIEEHIRRADGLLLFLQRQTNEYQTTKNKEVKDAIIREVEREIPLLKASQEHAVRELKRTDLNHIERFLYEKSNDQITLLLKHFTQIETSVKSAVMAEVFFAATVAPTQAPADWRQAYDQLLFSFIEEHIRRADGLLLFLQRQSNEYQTTKNKEVKDAIIREVEREIPLLKASQEHAVRELKRTDLNHIERFLYEKSNDQITLLLKHYTQIEASVKSAVMAEVFFAPTEAPVDWRSEYDHLLFSFIEEHIRRADGLLLYLQRQTNEYKTTKSKEVKDAIIREVEREIPLLKGSQEQAVRELKRTDLNHIERFLYEKSNDQITLLLKHYTQIEASVKSATFFRFF